ncbi:IS66 family insertion sequence element accessory protein TnpB [Lactobacillus taiwanensis]|uniref:IS66 family insertion sequence element accessory protein TnpB n=1 Tax=Lactobacillus taiwanensis TaxID=508451 RepID=UPI00242E1FAC|nr:IS66 family insertion sequence element accessory protein TnpB [Lactobacillus taiwanensis]
MGQVYIICGKTDLRKGIDDLAILIKEQFELDPLVVKFFSSAVAEKIVSKPFVDV